MKFDDVKATASKDQELGMFNVIEACATYSCALAFMLL